MYRARISLHEVTALQVDAHGRVQSPGRKGTKAATERDVMGNRVNTRPYNLRKYSKKPSHSQSRDELGPDLDILDAEEHTVSRSAESGKDGGGRRRKSRRRKKDAHLPDILPFLNPLKQPRSGTADASGPNDREDDVPSSDLLKTIHYFSSVYYDEKGFLSKPSTKNESTSREQSATLERAGSVSSDESQERQREKGPGGSRAKSMYRALDGSALLFIGMLVHEHVASRIHKPEISMKEMEERIRADEERLNRMRKQWPKRKKRASSEPDDEEDLDDEADKSSRSSGLEDVDLQESDKESSD